MANRRPCAFSGGPQWPAAFLALLGATILALNLSLAHGQTHQPLGRIVITDHQANMGGSYNPPTYEHLGLPVRIMERFGFSFGRMVVAYPYKKNAAPASVTEKLTRNAVSHTDVVLEANSIAHRDFQSPSYGEARWVDQSGKQKKLIVDDFDIRSQNTETVNTLKYLAQRNGGPLKNFWISGGDSFASVPSWGATWKQLFEYSHWIVVSRPGFDKGEKAVNFKRHDPLRSVLGDEFINNYEYRFDDTNRIHIYENKDPNKPGIYVIEQPTLNDSSSMNRASLAEAGDHAHAQAGLQPSVFKECVSKRLHNTMAAQEGYKVFTRKNLDIYLRHLYGRLERHPELRKDPAFQFELREMSRFHREAALDLVKAERDKPWAVAAMAIATEYTVERLQNSRNLRNLKRFLRETEQRYRIAGFAAAYVVSEIFDGLIIPAYLSWQYGWQSSTTTQGNSLNEILVPTLFASFHLGKELYRRIRLGGSLRDYNAVNTYRNKLLRGDSRVIISRRSFFNAIGLGGGAIAVNVVKSRWHHLVPLALRRADDRFITWHDLNVSTNELRAMIGDANLVDTLRSPEYLLDEVMQNPRTRLLFDLFMARRYFRPLHLGQVPHQIAGEYTQFQQQLIRELRQNSYDLFREFALDRNDDVAQETLAFIAEMASDTYAVVRQLQIDPTLASSDEFWTMVIDLMATEYPGRKAAHLTGSQKAKIALKVDVLIDALNSINPDFLRGVAVTYEGKEPLEVFGMIPTGLRSDSARNSFRRYVLINKTIFQIPDFVIRAVNTSSTDDRWTQLPVVERNVERNNLIYGMDEFSTRVDQEFELLEAGLDRATKNLANREHHERANDAFTDALVHSHRAVESMKAELLDLQFEWARTLYPWRGHTTAIDEKQVPGYQKVRARYESLQSRIKAKLEGVRHMNQMMLGTVAANLLSIDVIRSSLGEIFGIPPKDNRLGMHSGQRALAHCKRLLGFM